MFQCIPYKLVFCQRFTFGLVNSRLYLLKFLKVGHDGTTFFPQVDFRSCLQFNLCYMMMTGKVQKFASYSFLQQNNIHITLYFLCQYRFKYSPCAWPWIVREVILLSLSNDVIVTFSFSFLRNSYSFFYRVDFEKKKHFETT